MTLYRLKIRPVSAWRTPWHADTLFGMLCTVAARAGGSDFLQREIVDPSLDGRPPFVLSDAFPGDLLPIPQVLRLRPYAEESRKTVKKARWLSPASFRRMQSGAEIPAFELLADDVAKSGDRAQVVLSRAADTSVGVFHLAETWLTGADYLSVYIRTEEKAATSVRQLFHELSLSGFGADSSTGSGQFEVCGNLEPVSWLAETRQTSSGVVVLSTFQPAVGDPTSGYWELLTKYGKIGPDFGLNNVFKRPMVFLKPGACFFTDPNRAALGRAIPMREYLEPGACRELEAQGKTVMHPAFGLAVPMSMEE